MGNQVSALRTYVHENTVGCVGNQVSALRTYVHENTVGAWVTR